MQPFEYTYKQPWVELWKWPTNLVWTVTLRPLLYKESQCRTLGFHQQNNCLEPKFQGWASGCGSRDDRIIYVMDVLHFLFIWLIQTENLEISLAKVTKWLTIHIPLTVYAGQEQALNQPSPLLFFLALFDIRFSVFLSFLPSRFM